MKKAFLKLFLFIFIFNILFINFSLNKSNAQAAVPSTGPSDTAVQAIGDLNQNGKGIIDCNTSQNPKPCTPADFFKMLTKLGKLFLYLLIICVGLGGVIIGAMYPYYGDNPAMLAKIKGAIFKFFTAMLFIVLATSMVFALLTQLGANSDILQIIKKLLATNDFIQTSYAQTSADIARVSGTTGKYTNFFGTTDPVLLIHNLIKFLVTFIAIPMLILAVI
jgi:hypothetical protein